MQILGVILIFAGIWFVQFRPDVEAPYTPDKQVIAHTADSYMSAANPWSKAPGAAEAPEGDFPNCADPEPMRRGDPRFRPQDDRNGDGLICWPAGAVH
jgi:hypothetical protein